MSHYDNFRTLLESAVDIPTAAAEVWTYIADLPVGHDASALSELMREFDRIMVTCEALSSTHFPEEWQQEISTLGNHVDSTLSWLVSTNPEPARFAEILCRYLRGSLPFVSDEQRQFGLWWILIDPLIPYFQVPDEPEDSDDEAFENALDEAERTEVGAKIRFIINCQFSSVAHEAALLAEILHGKSREELAVLIGILSRQKEALLTDSSD